MKNKLPLLYRTNLLVLALFIASVVVPRHVAASIKIDSIKTTASTCANNGSITVFAVSTAPAMLYSIIAGPVTQPVQTNNQFNSLPAGFYTVRVTNAASEVSTQGVIVTGSYTQLDFAPRAKSPYCPGGNDGQITGNLIPGTGNGPFTWELVSPSPLTAGPQVSDTFLNLVAGNYSVRVTDACGSYRTIVATVPDIPATNLTIIEQLCRISMVGCDSAMLMLTLHCSAIRMPLTCTFTTNAGTITTTTPTRVDTTADVATIIVQQIFPSFTYGNFITATITDACGSTTSLPVRYAQPYNFCSATTSDFEACVYNTSFNFDLNNSNCYNSNNLATYAKAPLRYSITDAATNQAVAADTLEGYEYFSPGYNAVSGFQLNSLPGNKTYNISITDSCGNVYAKSFFVPAVAAPPPSVADIQLTPDACVDSAGFATIMLNYFKQKPAIVFLSGPPMMGSTKPGYEYNSSYAYPDMVTEHGHFIGGASDIFFISGLSAGTYQFKAIDSCGSEVFDSLVIAPAVVSDFKHRFWYKKGCLGQNEIHYTVNNPSGLMSITNTTTGVNFSKYYSSQDFAHPIDDSLLNLPSGTYQVSFTYSGYLSSASNSNTSLNQSQLSCQVITETVVIEGYQTPAIAAANSILCHNNISVQLLPDSSKGVPPYQYEIIAGPQTFALQNSNIFTTNAAGIYTARIYDICGNASTANITVDTLSFPPLQPIQRTCNSISFTYGASPYYSYSWAGPGGQLYTTDTLNIDPITQADTGTYNIARIVNINGCKDTFYTTYHLTFPLTYRQVKTVCAGTSVTIGNSTYNSTGVFADTLISSIGCDSIVVLDLAVLTFKKDSIVRTICAGQSFVVGIHSYTSTGIYRDTLATATCDSIVILNLTVSQVKRDSIARTICGGQNFVVGTHTYTSTGIYRDTLATATCDSIVVLNLTVSQVKRDSIARTICAGQNFVVGTHTYTSTGIYRDTLATATCDSIVILNLTVTPNPSINITATPQPVLAGIPVQLNTTTATNYLWMSAATLSNNSIQNPVATLSSSAWVYLHVAANPGNCIAVDSIFIRVIADTAQPCGTDTYIYVPNAFTPDGNGVNDVFKIHSNNIRLGKFRVYNRWGEMVFETSNIVAGWNGTYKGKIIPGNYVYWISYFECDRTNQKTKKGSIMLIR